MLARDLRLYGLWIAACALSATPAPAGSAAAPGAMTDLPQEVSAFLLRRSDCTHWAGEEPYDAARGRQIAAAIRQLRCDRLDVDERRLLKRYVGDSQIRRAIESAGDGGD